MEIKGEHIGEQMAFSLVGGEVGFTSRGALIAPQCILLIIIMMFKII